MTFPKRAPGRIAAEFEAAPRERGGDLAMIILLALVFAPIVAMHVAFASDGSAERSAPAAQAMAVSAR